MNEHIGVVPFPSPRAKRVVEGSTRGVRRRGQELSPPRLASLPTLPTASLRSAGEGSAEVSL